MSQTVLIFLLLIVTSLDFKTNGFIMKMIPISSPNLKILPPHFTAQERHRFLVNMSISRVNRHTKNSISPNDIESRVYVSGSSYYITSLSFGRGPGHLTTYMLLDTACPETWVQCEGCNPCIELASGNFKYMGSSTFKKMGLYDPMCHPDDEYEGSCGFELTYTDTRTIGFVGRDTFYFDKATGGSRLFPVPDVAFGCGLHNENFDFGSNTGPHNVIAGIHGLAPGPRSFLTQLSNIIKGRFSYCLVSSNLINIAYSQMYFGDSAEISGDDQRIVQTISMYNNGPYHLYLNEISVDGTKLPIDPSIFEFDPENFDRGFFIDSGTPYTILAKSAYDPLKDAVAQYFSDNYGMHPIETEEHLCYTNNLSDIPNYPSVILHFELNGHHEEIDWTLDRDKVFRTYSSHGGICLAIIDVDDPGPSLFGAYQQANFHILYDVDNGLLSFVPANCQAATPR
ncbi:hypothetical protein vseg_011310 [Gypsophila vaccaria]